MFEEAKLLIAPRYDIQRSRFRIEQRVGSRPNAIIFEGDEGLASALFGFAIIEVLVRRGNTLTLSVNYKDFYSGAYQHFLKKSH